MRKEVSHIEVPKEWESQNDWDSHLPLIFLAINKVPHDTFYEFGIGHGSTPKLKKWYTEINQLAKEYYSYETNKEWFEKFVTEEYSNSLRSFSFIHKNHCLSIVDDYLKWELLPNDGIVFIDVAPAEKRKHLIDKFSNKAKVILVHDSEESSNYVYGMKEVLSTFKYRLDYRPEGKPHTTAVSNFIDVSKWVVE